jgi:ribosome-binding factor A
MKESGRVLRVADHLREELAEIIRREMRDRRVGMVSVNDVRVTRDLAYADIYVSSLEAREPSQKQELIDVLNGAAGFLRSAVARGSTMRTTPQLRFHYDELIEQAVRLEGLIEKAVQSDTAIRQKRDDEDGA